MIGKFDLKTSLSYIDFSEQKLYANKVSFLKKLMKVTKKNNIKLAYRGLNVCIRRSYKGQ